MYPFRTTRYLHFIEEHFTARQILSFVFWISVLIGLWLYHMILFDFQTYKDFILMITRLNRYKEKVMRTNVIKTRSI